MKDLQTTMDLGILTIYLECCFGASNSFLDTQTTTGRGQSSQWAKGEGYSKGYESQSEPSRPPVMFKHDVGQASRN